MHFLLEANKGLQTNYRPIEQQNGWDNIKLMFNRQETKLYEVDLCTLPMLKIFSN